MKMNAVRHPSGKINQDWSRRESERETMATVIDARQRIAGVTEAQARSSLSGSVLGLLFLDGKITRPEMEAGERYAEKMARYYHLTGIPFPSARAQELFSIRGYEGEVSESRAQKARSASDEMMKIEGILLRQKDGPQIKTTVRNVCLLDCEALRLMPEMQLKWLKCGLRELGLYFGAQIT